MSLHGNWKSQAFDSPIGSQAHTDFTGHVYALIDPRDNRIRYVGATQNENSRMAAHLSDAKRGIGTPKAEWIGELLQEGHEPRLVLLERVGADEYSVYRRRAETAERKWVRRFEEVGAMLTNTDHRS